MAHPNFAPSIRMKLLMLAGAMALAFLVASEFMRATIAETREAANVQSADLALLTAVTEASRQFSEMKYWYADLANSLAEASGTKAAAAHAGFLAHLGAIETVYPAETARIAAEVPRIEALSRAAGEAYRDNDRALGNELVEKARASVAAVDREMGKVFAAVETRLGVAGGHVGAITERMSDIAKVTFLGTSAITVAIGILLWRNVFRPLEGITRGLIEASKDPEHFARYLRRPDARRGGDPDLRKAEEALSILLTGLIESIHEHRERALLEKQLANAQKLEALGTLAGGIAHEINTPVQYVGDNVRFLAGAISAITKVIAVYRQAVDEMEAGRDGRGRVPAIRRAETEGDLDFLLGELPVSIEQSMEGVDRISEIVQAIKGFSYPDAQEKTPTDINQCIRNTITVARNQWKYVAEMETRLDAALPPVPCFPGQLNQVVLNVIVNAAHAIEEKAGGDKGRISVSTALEGDWIAIRVSDTGCGMTRDIQKKIFDPFFTTKEVGKGTGQGLSISHTIVTRKLGGTIEVSSEPGEGATFTIRVPAGESGRMNGPDCAHAEVA